MTDTLVPSTASTLSDSVSRAEKNLTKLEKTAADSLDFIWEGISFDAKSNASPDGSAIIRLKARIGQIFYSVEDPIQRAAAVDCISKTNRGIDGRYNLHRSGEVSFESATTTDKHLLGADLMGAVTLILLEAESHLRTLRSHLKPLHMN